MEITMQERHHARGKHADPTFFLDPAVTTPISVFSF